MNLKKLLLLFLVFTSNSLLSQWNQIGSTLIGNDYNVRFGYGLALNQDGHTVAVCSPHVNTSTGENIKVFVWDGSNWILKGNPIPNYCSDVKISASGETLAVLSLTGSSFERVIRIYKWNTLNNSWEMDSEKLFEIPDMILSYDLDSSGNNIVVGIPEYIGKGYVLNYDLTSSSWTLKGDTIHGDYINGQTGSSVGISSNGETIIIGSKCYGGVNYSAGKVKVLEYTNNSWSPKGQPIEGSAWDESIGLISDINSNGNVIAVVGVEDTINNRVKIQCYNWTGSNWTQKGSTIFGEFNQDNNTLTSKSNHNIIDGSGNRIVLNQNESDFHGTGYGRYRVYEFTNDWVQIGGDIYGSNSYQSFGFASDISANGDVVALSSYSHNTNTGAVKVFGFGNSARLEVNNNPTIKLLPNPTKDIVQIRSIHNISEVTMFDLTGKKVKSIYSNFKVIDVSSLKKGIYIVRVLYNDQTISSSKLIKK